MPYVSKTIKIKTEQETWLKQHKDLNFSRWVRESFDKYIASTQQVSLSCGLSAIIVAAGYEKRLFPFNKNKPKAMLDIKGKTILERQLEILTEIGISRIAIVRGYLGNKIQFPDIYYYENMNFDSTGILLSLFCAEKEMDGGFVFLYSDIIFKKEILEILLKNESDICLLVDTNWENHYQDRNEHPIAEAELVTIDKEKNIITSIGCNINPSDAYGEFVGIARFSVIGAEILKESYYRNNEDSLKHEKNRKARFVEMIQQLCDEGKQIEFVTIAQGWMEIDTFEDYRNAWAAIY